MVPFTAIFRNRINIYTQFLLLVGAAIRAGHVPGGVSLPAAAAPRRAPLREGFQHREAVQALLLQARRAVPEHGGHYLYYLLPRLFGVEYTQRFPGRRSYLLDSD